MSALRYSLRDGIAVITLDRAPVNALSAPLRQGLMHALDMARSSARAAVIRAKGPVFSAGGDITEFDADPIPPALPEVCAAIEDMPIPVVAAVRGAALGGGCELALAAHYRVAGREARFGLPEVALGLIPGAGGTQRLPRLIGPARALDMILSGRPVDARTGLALGLVDDVVDGDPDSAAMIWARQVLAEGMGSRRTRDATEGLRDGAGFLSEVAARRAGADTPEAGLILDCVEGALLLPFEAGMRRERAIFLELLGTDRARALRHLFRAERAAARAPNGAAPAPLTAVAVLGGGPAATAVAGGLLIAGTEVTLLAQDEAALTAAIGQVIDGFDALVSDGRMAAADRDRHLEHLRALVGAPAPPGSDMLLVGDVSDAGGDLVSAARAGDPEMPVVHLSDERATTDGGALALTHPPLRAGALIELAGPAVAETPLLSLARALKLQPVFAGPTPESGAGLIVARLRGAARQAAEACLADGALPEQVDAALCGGGFAVGLFQAEDRTGIAAARAAWARRTAERDAADGATAITDALLAAGRTGRAAGAGWYDHDPATGTARPSLAVAQLIEDLRSVPARTIPATQIRARVFAAMANAGAWMLSEGTARRADDIDVAAVLGLGLARDVGGPMFDADRRGLLEVRAALEELSAIQPGGWTPAPLLDSCIRNGKGLLTQTASALPD